MPKQGKSDEYEEFVRQSYLRSTSEGSAHASSSSCYSSSPDLSSPESVYPNDDELLLDLVAASTATSQANFTDATTTPDAESVCRGFHRGLSRLSKTSLEAHTRKYESKDRFFATGCTPWSPLPLPHGSRTRNFAQSDFAELRRCRTPSPRHRVLDVSLSANSPVLGGRLVYARNRPCYLDLQRLQRLNNFLADSCFDREDTTDESTTSSTSKCTTNTRTTSASTTGTTTATTHRVRSFSTSSKRIINCGDEVRARSGSNTSESCCGDTTSGSGSADASPRSASPTLSHCSCADSPQLPPLYRVAIIGDDSVGKISLTRQFTTSEYTGHLDNTGEDEKHVNVILDGDEVELDCTTLSIDDYYMRCHCEEMDAFVVVYSVCDFKSYQSATRVLDDIRHARMLWTPVILVANKADIVRNRIVNDSDGRKMAQRYDCKYIDVSALLNHKVDELLAGVVSQIRLVQRKLARKNQTSSVPTDPFHPAVFFQRAARGLSRIVSRRKHPWSFRSCDNLLVL